jgi:hypothetical protein
MLNWHFSEFLKDSILFAEKIDCADFVKNRYDVQAIVDCSVNGSINFDGKVGKLQMSIKIEALVLAANTGKTTSYHDAMTLEEDFTVGTIEYVAEPQKHINLIPYIYSLIDVMIPTYVVDETNELGMKNGKNWQIIDEADYVARKQEETSQQNELSNLSSLLSQKSDN